MAALGAGGEQIVALRLTGSIDPRMATPLGTPASAATANLPRIDKESGTHGLALTVVNLAL